MNILRKTVEKNTKNLKESIQHNHITDNDALQRLKGKLNADHAHSGEAITSYDRMHHRHNRG